MTSQILPETGLSSKKAAKMYDNDIYTLNTRGQEQLRSGASTL